MLIVTNWLNMLIARFSKSFPEFIRSMSLIFEIFIKEFLETHTSRLISPFLYNIFPLIQENLVSRLIIIQTIWQNALLITTRRKSTGGK